MTTDSAILGVEAMIACPECDLLHRRRALPEGGSACCRRCGARLYTLRRNSLNRSLALTLTGAILFLISFSFPFLAIKAEGLMEETTLLSGVNTLYLQGWPALAALVGFTTVMVPIFQLASLLYVLVPLKLGRRPRFLASVFRLARTLHPWQMLEVFLIGILVAMVKLTKMATIVPGVAVFAFAALILVLAAIGTTLEPQLIWERLEVKH
jgi:paraquat-inducible protein A